MTEGRDTETVVRRTLKLLCVAKVKEKITKLLHMESMSNEMMFDKNLIKIWTRYCNTQVGKYLKFCFYACLSTPQVSKFI